MSPNERNALALEFLAGVCDQVGRNDGLTDLILDKGGTDEDVEGAVTFVELLGLNLADQAKKLRNEAGAAAAPART